MYGTIIGDLAGSIHEYSQIKNLREIKISKTIEKDSFYSDDSILMMATLEALLKKEEFGTKYKDFYEVYKEYKPDFYPYFKYPFSPRFIEWCKGTRPGTSSGNGALSRLAPIPMLVEDEIDMYENVRKSVKCSHDSKDALDSASIMASIIWMARNGYDKYDIMDWHGIDVLEYKPFTSFNQTCGDTLPNCLYQTFNANSFEEAIRNTVEMGGDTDTNAAIVGAMAEPIYGIPDELIEEANKHIPETWVKVLKKGYSKIKKS